MKLNNPFGFDHEGIEKDFDDSHYIPLDPSGINHHQAKHGENNWLRASYEPHMGPSQRRKLKENDKSINAEFPFYLSEEMKDDIEDIPWNDQTDGDINTHNLSKLRSDADMSIQSKKKRASISTRVKKCRERKEKFYRDLEERAARLEKK